MARRIRHGRIQLDKAGVRAYTGAAASTVNLWSRKRDVTNFPAVAETDNDGRDWWWLDEIATFNAGHLAARSATFTTVDRRGDPDELITAPQAAKVLGYRDHRSLPTALLDNPDHVEELPSGRLRRRWRRATLLAYADGRATRHSTGRPAGSGTGPYKTHAYADDPRLAAALDLLAEAEAAGQGTRGLGNQLAQRLGLSARAGQRLIAAAAAARTHRGSTSGR